MTATLDTAATREDFIATMIERKGDPATLKVFADWLEQRGECDLAYAYRWAASRGRWPQRDRWRSFEGDVVFWWGGADDLFAPRGLPHSVDSMLSLRCVSRPIDKCFAALADALAQLRKDVAIADDN